MIRPYPHQQKALDSIESSDKGMIVIPTGGGKTNVMGWDILRNLPTSQVTLVVTPRILLTGQLSKEIDSLVGGSATYIPLFVYSGEAIEREEESLESEQILDISFSTTSPAQVRSEYDRSLETGESLIIFTTYHSLDRVLSSDIPIDRAYLDEAHNACAISFSSTVAKLSKAVGSMFSFTATPKRGDSAGGRGNNNTDVFGEVICDITADELVKSGVIVPPMISTLYSGIERGDTEETKLSRDVIKQTILHYEEVHGDCNHKVLVAADGTNTIFEMTTQTDLISWLNDKGYDVFHTTSKYGDWYNDLHIKDRNEFLSVMQQVGSNPSKKMVVIHYSILSEGIDIPGLTGALILRNMNDTILTQTIGRVLRMLPSDRHDILEGNIEAGDISNYRKGYGIVTVPIHKDDGDDTLDKVIQLYQACFVMGMTHEYILNVENVRGSDSLELPQELDDKLSQKIKEVEAQWEWVYRKDELTSLFPELDLL